MGLIDKLKKTFVKQDWSQGRVAELRVYDDVNGEKYGVVSVNEYVQTILPKIPQKEFRVGDKVVENWKIVFVSRSQDKVVGEMEYSKALEKLKPFTLDYKLNALLIKELTPNDMESLF